MSSMIIPLVSFATTTLIYSYIRGVAKNPELKVEKPNFSSAIVICSLNEGQFIEKCLISLHENSMYKLYPEYFEIILVDSYSYDRTTEVAKPYVDKILFSEPGKLNAKDLAIRKTNADLIINIDADAVAPCQWLNLIHRNFKNPEVIGVTGPTYGWGYLIDRMYGLAAFVLRPNMRLHGRNSAFLRNYYLESGGFNLNIDQQDVYAMVMEEEIELAYRLSQFGKMVFDPLCWVRELSKRRYECGHVDIESCDINDPLCRYCRQIERGERFGRH